MSISLVIKELLHFKFLYLNLHACLLSDKQEEVTDEPRYFIENEAKVYEDVTVEPDDTRKKELKTTAPTYANVDRSV